MGLPYTLEPQLDQNSVFIGLSQTNVSTSAVTIQQSYFLDCIEQVEQLKMNVRNFPEYQSHLTHFNKLNYLKVCSTWLETLQQKTIMSVFPFLQEKGYTKVRAWKEKRYHSPDNLLIKGTGLSEGLKIWVCQYSGISI